MCLLAEGGNTLSLPAVIIRHGWRILWLACAQFHRQFFSTFLAWFPSAVSQIMHTRASVMVMVACAHTDTS
jgi:hypothetical protein